MMVHRTRIKICGVRDAAAARAAAAAGADAIGLVFFDRSPRAVSVDRARHILAALPTMVEAIGLFVNAPPPVVFQTARDVGLRTVQLHGSESPEQVEALAPLAVIKALHLGDDTEEPGTGEGGGVASARSATTQAEHVETRLAPWRGRGSHLAGLLWDAPPTDAAASPGGAGRAFDWTRLVRGSGPSEGQGLPPIILAGGLTAENVARAISLVRPYAVDVSSGVESSPGVKDPARILAFCRSVRRADAEAEQKHTP